MISSTYFGPMVLGEICRTAAAHQPGLKEGVRAASRVEETVLGPPAPPQWDSSGDPTLTAAVPSRKAFSRSLRPLQYAIIDHLHTEVNIHSSSLSPRVREASMNVKIWRIRASTRYHKLEARHRPW